MAVKVRTLTMEEAHELHQLAHAHKAPHRLVQLGELFQLDPSVASDKALQDVVNRHVQWVRHDIQ